MKKALVVLGLAAVGIAAAAEGARYLIICNDSYLSSIQPLAQWKHAKGVQTRVVPQSQVGYDTASIKNYVRNAYNNWPVKPEYVLLVGSPNNIPARFYSGQWAYYSDNIYGDMTGSLLQEIPVGRFPCRSTAQLDVMVAKTLAYEKTPDVADTVWMRKLTTICGDRGDSDGWVYWNDARTAINLARNAGFVAFDSLASSRGDTVTDIYGSVNGGTGIVLFRGTAQSNWYRPFAVDVNYCYSSKRLPVILSITCETMTLAPNESMVGDAWLKAGTVANPKGGVAFFGNTHSAGHVAQVRSACARGFVTGLFAEGRWHLGHAVVRAKLQLYNEYPQYTSDYRGFNLLGDPELGIWTGVPRRTDVSHPTQIEPGAQTIPVNVTLAGAPVESALVCLSMDTAVYACGYTDFQGLVNLSVNPVDSGLMRLVVTGRNLYPYDTNIVVGEVGIAEQPAASPRPARLTAAPALFAGATRLSWEDGRSGTVRIYDATGKLVRTIAACGSAAWDGTNETGARCQAGLYVARLAGSASGGVRLVKLD